MKQQWILYGSDFAHMLLKSLPHPHHVIAIVANQPHQYEKSIMDVPLVSPDIFNQTHFDLIIITNKNQNDILRKLTKEFKIPLAKIKPCPKFIENRPFTCEENRQLAKLILNRLNTFFSNHQLRAYVDFGTLLGFMREGDLISWDSDLDFSMHESDYLALLENFPAILSLDENFNITCKPFIRGITLLFTHKSDQYPCFGADIFNRIIDGKKSIIYCKTLSFEKTWQCPSIHFDLYDTMNIAGHCFYIPYQVKEYLKITYGDWQNPNPLFSEEDWINT